MRVFLDIETVPAADKAPYIEEAKNNFKAPSGLTKAQAGADLNMLADEIKFTSAGDLTARWEREMAEQKAPEVAEQAWRKTALDGTYGRVLSIAWKLESDDFGVGISINRPEIEENTLIGFFAGLKQQLVAASHDRPATFVGHNIAFDLKFLFRRAVILGLKPSFPLPFRGRHDNEYFCTMQAWCEYGERISLSNLCAALDIPAKTGMDGSQVCDYWLADRYDEIAEYNKQDVRCAMAAYQKLTFAGENK